MEKAPLGTTAEYNRPSGAVRTKEGRRIESSGSVGKHEWSFGKRGLRLSMAQEVLGALPELGIRAGRAVLRWNKASRLMRRKTSTDMVNLNLDFEPSTRVAQYVIRIDTYYVLSIRIIHNTRDGQIWNTQYKGQYNYTYFYTYKKTASRAR
jgi:hypothetical protein